MEAARAMIVAALVIATAGFSTAAANEADTAFKARCADCHGDRDVARWARIQPDPARRKAWLDQILQHHHTHSEAERSLIIRHIEGIIASRTAPR
jgi:cytochrome c553